MNLEELKEAIQEAIKNNIPFSPPESIEFTSLEHIVTDSAQEMNYVKAYPREFKHKTWAFHLSPQAGLRWGYVSNGSRVGWFEGRESTPLPERDSVIKDSEPVYGHKADLL